ncbi:hypothetical protein FACS1894168_0200 [Deltaproteobacteria bacterium]|nr:hypothetical protein FACS1894168_0200 [Deltaproteobacteria bacterium]
MGAPLLNGSLYGGFVGNDLSFPPLTSAPGDAFSGNSLHVAPSLTGGISVGGSEGVQNFEFYNFTFPKDAPVDAVGGGKLKSLPTKPPYREPFRSGAPIMVTLLPVAESIAPLLELLSTQLNPPANSHMFLQKIAAWKREKKFAQNSLKNFFFIGLIFGYFYGYLKKFLI